MPVAVEIKTASWFEDSVDFGYSFVHPVDISVHAAIPTIFKTADFAFVPPNHSVVAIGEKRRISVAQINRIVRNGFENFEIVTENEGIHRLKIRLEIKNNLHKIKTKKQKIVKNCVEKQLFDFIFHFYKIALINLGNFVIQSFDINGAKMRN